MKNKNIIVLQFGIIFSICYMGVFGSVSPGYMAQPPEHPEKKAYYLFYLHGRIIEESGIRPEHPRYGYYEYEKILGELSRKGFTVISEPRKKGTDVMEYAGKVVKQVKYLLDKKVSPTHITVVGASKGGMIAVQISGLLKNTEINFVILAGLFEQLLENRELKLYGNILSIHDRSDQFSIVPDQFFERSEGLGIHKSIVTSLGVGHGLLYKPYREWVDPLTEWSGIKHKSQRPE